ncbi:MAG TPA: pyridoxine 5'-phosphate synthase [Flavobacteriales bacterium]|nr:pyridoxine 5'-phosphate synthase [Flavobacteriales bacterium]
MTRLSVNINKIATIRNARGGVIPNLLEAARRIESFGGQGITVHPRPDERHIRYEDVRQLRPVVRTELNVEGYPSRAWLDLVIESKADQATLVPDAADAITSNSGWDTIKNQSFLGEVVAELKSHGIRTSIFIDTDSGRINAAADLGVECVELYTEPFALQFLNDPDAAVSPFIEAAKCAQSCGLMINAGHDLSLENLRFFHDHLPYLDEVSIGHALISDALYFGLENTVQMYLAKLQ